MVRWKADGKVGGGRRKLMVRWNVDGQVGGGWSDARWIIR